MNQRGKIKSFVVWKTARIGAIVIAVLLALPVAPILVLMTLARINNKFHSVHPHDFRDFFLLFAAIPLVYGIVGLVVVALASWLYNILSPRFGGIEVELIVDSDPAPSRLIPHDAASGAN
jgi:hypothetical protein